MRTLIVAFCCLLVPFAADAICQVNYEGQLASTEPVAVSFDPSGRIYVAQDNGVVVVKDKTGRTVSTIGGSDKKWKTILRTPSSVFYADGKIYVTDTGLDRIAVFSPDGDMITAYGEKGRAPGEFYNPSDIYVYKGVLYVADTGNDRIQVLGKNGVFANIIGDFEDPEKRVDGPREVAVDDAGRIYVVDQAGTVKLYDRDGRYLKTVPGLANVSSLCLAREGIFVADGKEFSISLLTYDFKNIVTFGSAGKGRGQFKAISDIQVNGAGKIYAADAKRGLIHVFLPDNVTVDVSPLVNPGAPPTTAVWKSVIHTKPKQELSDLSIKDNQTIYAIDDESGAICVLQGGRQTQEIRVPGIDPEALAFDQKGDMYVLADDEVAKLTPSGQVDFTFGPSGGGSTFASKPGDLAISSDNLVYVADRSGKKIHVFNTDGIFIKAIENVAPGIPLEDPAAVAVDDVGQLYLLDAGKKAVSIFSPEGKQVTHFFVGKKGDDLVDLAVAGGKIYVLDQKGYQVRMFSKTGKMLAHFGSRGEGLGRFDNPLSIAATTDFGFWVSDSGNQRLQEFSVVYTPDVPADVKAVAGARNVKMQWGQSNDPLIQEYIVYRTTKADGVPVRLAGTTVNAFNDQTVSPNVDYFYRISARARAGNESILSPPTSASAEKFSVPAPTGLVATPSDFSVTLSWTQNPSAHFAQYVIYRDGTEVARVTEPMYIDQQLAPDTAYVYQVAAESTDKVLSLPTAVSVSTRVTTRPPLEFESIELSDIFSNTYKSYEKNGIGRVVIRNNTKNYISKLKVLFTIKKFMDFASESIVKDLPPGHSRELELKAVFNDNILSVTEDTPVQTEITASYYVGGKLKTFAAKPSINVYEKHKMRWDDRERVGAFVTTKDEVVLGFVRSIVTQYNYPSSDPIIGACIVFDALGASGLTYAKDPSNSYQETVDDTELVDYLQYPRETLKHKSGDCDDLVTLYAAALESIGIRTRFVEVPGHIFLMFKAGRADKLGTDTMNDMLVIEKDGAWIPVEVTSVGKPFTSAWEFASREYYAWKDRELSAIDLHEAWLKYKPASLPQTDYRPKEITKAVIEKKYDNEFNDIRQTSIKIRNRVYFAGLKGTTEEATEARLQLGIEYARYGLFDEAARFFNQALKDRPDDAAVLNNLANVNFLQEKYSVAIDVYKKAIAADPKDSMTRVNLAKAYLKVNNEPEAQKVFQEACGIDPEISKAYRAMALKLLGPS